MKVAQAAGAETRAFRDLAIETVHESKHNPRRHFDEAGMAQLVDSVRTVGIITPILVRPQDYGYEIAAGHRRYRAARTIGLETVPCHIRSMTDQEFLEVLTIENLQREDVHPLDEAAGYHAMLSAPYRMPVEKIAERVGRSVKYIYDRVKLLDLSEPLQELFWEGMLTAGHAILLARLSDKDQARALGDREQSYLNGGLFQAEHGLFDPDAGDEDSDARIPEKIKARSVRELQGWIDQHVRFDRTDVDPMLFPETVATLETVEEPHGDVVPITYEHVAAPDVKAKERTLTYQSWRRADGQYDSKTCEHAVLGCVVFGVHRGEVFKICTNKKGCAVHWKEEQQQARRLAAATAKGPEAVKQQQDKDAADRKRKERAAKEESLIRQRTLEQIVASLKKPVRQEDLLELAVQFVTDRVNDNVAHEHMHLLGFEDTYPNAAAVRVVAKKQDDLLVWMFKALILGLENEWGSDRDQRIAAFAKRHRVDVAHIERATKAELDGLAVPAPAVQASADEAPASAAPQKKRGRKPGKKANAQPGKAAKKKPGRKPGKKGGR